MHVHSTPLHNATAPSAPLRSADTLPNAGRPVRAAPRRPPARPPAARRASRQPTPPRAASAKLLLQPLTSEAAAPATPADNPSAPAAPALAREELDNPSSSSAAGSAPAREALRPAPPRDTCSTEPSTWSKVLLIFSPGHAC